MNKLNIIGLLFLILISSCRKEINDFKENTITDSPTIINFEPIIDNISGSLIGQVIDENNQPMVSVKVTINSQPYYTNDYGHFIINDVTMNSRGQLVTIQREGYFDGSRRFFPKEGVQSRVKIQLIKQEFNHEFSAEAGGEVVMNGGAKVTFQPNSIKDADGNIYQGIVKVASHWMDPLADETLDKMPGNLQGVNQASEEVALETFGMIAVELESASGDKLNIADGKTAEISMPVSNIQLADAADVIPLWSYNEEYGLWAEESSATLQNNTYVGEVSHFSFWNCDYPYDLVEFDVTFVDDNNTPLVNFIFNISITNGPVLNAYPDANGLLSGLVPANENLTISLKDVCGDVLFTQDVGPFATNTSLGTITISLPPIYNTTIQGTLVDCDGNTVLNGIVIATIEGNTTHHYITGGTFDILLTIPPCSNLTSDYSIVGVNLDIPEEGIPVSATTQTTNDLGDLSTCGSALENYMIVTINGESKYILNMTVYSQTGSGWTYMESGSANLFAGIGFGGDSVGDFSANNYIEGLSIDSWNIHEISNIFSTFSSFIVTQYDTKLVGTFSGQVLNNGVEVFAEGEFNINL